MTFSADAAISPSSSATRKPWLAAMLIAAASTATAQVAAQGVDHRAATIRLGYERIELPGNEGLGLVGTTYLMDIGSGFALGPAAYGAITGQRGGLFTLGAELAWRTRIAGPLELEAGYYVGGGGGGNAPVGGGLMVRPHADLLWNFGRYKAGLSASQVRFANGRIDSKQVGLVLSADTDFSFIHPRADGSLPAALGASGMGFDRIVPVVGAYFPPSGTARVSGAPMGPRLYYVGARLERFMQRERSGASIAPYWGIETAGAAGGGVAGYAEYLATLGAETSPWGPATTLGARVAVGMGGGGDVSLGGGLLVKTSLYGAVKISRDLSLGLEAGYAKAPDGEFKAPFASLNLNWALDTPGAAGGTSLASGPGPAVKTEWVVGVGTYRAARTDGSTRSLQNVVLKGNRFVADNVYVTAQAHSAYSGQAGGYTAGLVGAGYESPQWANFKVGAELLVGAAGGGGVATGGGALVQPMGYLSYKLGESLTARVGLGRIRSNSGQLSSNVGEVLVAFPFGVSPRP